MAKNKEHTPPSTYRLSGTIAQPGIHLLWTEHRWPKYLIVEAIRVVEYAAKHLLADSGVPVFVTLVPDHALGDPESGEPMAFGVFLRPPVAERKGAGVFIACGFAMDSRLTPNRDERLAIMAESIFHELLHVREWLDGKEPNERRVNRQMARIHNEYRSRLRRTPWPPKA